MNGRTYRLRFASGREHDFQVRPRDSADDFVWTWSGGRSFPQGAHERDLEAGYCYIWETTWDTRDDNGRLVAPGTYAVEASVDFNGRSRTAALPLTVTPR